MRTSLSVTHYGDFNQPILFMVHPAGTLHTIWLSLIVYLQYDFHIIAPDINYPDWQDVTFEQVVADLAELIPAGRPMHGIGLGLGADLLLSLVMRYPDMLDSLTLADALLDTTIRDMPPIPPLLQMIFRNLPDSILRYCLLSGMHYMDRDTLQCVKADMARLGKEGILAQLNLYNTYEILQPLESVSTQTLLFYGGLSHPMYLRDADHLHTTLSKSRLHIVPRADQGACFYDADTFIATLHDHINGVFIPEIVSLRQQPTAIVAS